MKPTTAIDGLGSALRFVPIALHYRIATTADFARLADRHEVPVFADELDFEMRAWPPDGLHLFLQRIVLRRHVVDRTCLGLTVGNEHFLHVHVVLHALHHFDRTRRASHDAGAQRR